MTSMADVSKVFQSFSINTYHPIILVIHCTFVMFGVWERLFNLCVSEKLQFSTDDSIDDDYTEKVGRQRK
jgi:hypothetical protein